ncbi:MAG: UDP-N-acetylmuramoyl-tripeptide--D-alanyl-D-alanine ligase [Gemmatimonadales bacterium]|nr:UDP-N-acetylmuramoyl-tripeptide--D-alanyl-D-alanine ligase [Gemmatimonadales bacterium]NIN50006.1 UDP-N-acetylmuramoyl-tripeptide--D-alanyl-D-alanine ligase [Gemmatimonadales bacterium]NIP07470.1 UDP-N-acetylmuramoyl-tripeptide--D-alanyl-D-alanine ligase [Gemmatimonadales bacterium]NIR03109.1 UDP-N-acetylmuramoyl-tripeptide--D-alanyl-D-alanine ligase [Gemmatimonadales bacterium]NIS66821.1 UDP-N-acetylmuramoyl-tripeptide--D-alanyl-D-alanine ligase [Gemmatimonadales bacterium]
MSDWTSERVARVLGTPSAPQQSFPSISTDTRSMEPGALFVALVGERFDAHEFLGEAKARGASGAVVRRGTPPVDGLVLFEVEDTLSALGALARDRRHGIRGPVVAVTGTNGKTATKEMLARAVETRWHTHATRGNLNNLVGVPLTVLSAPSGTEALVAEAGASEPGEMARLNAILEPTVGVITNVAVGHVEGFGSLEGVLREKLALLQNAPVAVVGTEPPELARGARVPDRHVVVAGTSEYADVRPDAWRLDDGGKVQLALRGVQVSLPLVGRHQVDNAMIALATALELECDLAAVASALRDVALPPGRCEVLRQGDLVVLHDAYNANPSSLTAALATAEVLRGDRPLVVVLGTMLELGDESAALHAEVADRVMAASPILVAVTGAFVPAFRRHASALGDRLLTADDAATLGELLAPRLGGNEFVLIKASRGVRLERAIPYILPDSDVPCSTIC